MPTAREPNIVYEDREGIRVIHIREERLGDSIMPEAFKQAMLASIEGVSMAAVDLSESAYMASEQIGKLISFNRQARDQGTRVVYYDMQPFMRDTFHEMRLDTVFEIYEDLDEAMAALRR